LFIFFLYAYREQVDARWNTLLLFSDYQNVTVWGPNMETITSSDAPPEPSS